MASLTTEVLKKRKLSAIKNLILNHYGETAQYQKINHMILMMFDKMYKHKGFAKLSIPETFDQLVTISMFVIHRETASIRENMPLSGAADTSDLAYDPLNGFRKSNNQLL